MNPFLILGFFIPEVWQKFMNISESSSKAQNNISMKYQDFYFSKKIKKVISGSEGLEEKSYLDHTGVATIGYGSTFIVSDQGKNYGKVILGGTLVGYAKRYFGIDLITKADKEKFAERLMKNHIKFIHPYKFIAPKLDQQNVKFDENLAIALIDAGYQSGSIYSKVYQDYTSFLTFIGLNIDNKKKVAELYGKMRLSYFKTYVKSVYYSAPFGMAKRVYANCYLIKYGVFKVHDHEKIYSQSRAKGLQVLKNNFVNEFGIII